MANFLAPLIAAAAVALAPLTQTDYCVCPPLLLQRPLTVESSERFADTIHKTR